MVEPGVVVATSVRRITPRAVFLTFFALFFLALACWSFASPLVASPDEQAHIIRAVALDHGQLGHKEPGNKVVVDVTVPDSINFTKYYPQCWQFHSAIAATCSPPWPTSEAPVASTTYVGHYPPLYYLLVGTGSYVSQQKSGIYIMRLVSSAISAFMVALAFYVIAKWGRRRSQIVGLFVAVTPMSLFLSGSVNASGFEITTAICLWTAAMVFALDYPDDPPKGLVIVLGVIGSVLALIRGLSPLWVIIVALTVGIIVGPRSLLALARRRRDVQVAAAGITVAGILAALWVFTQGTLNVLPVGVKVPPKDNDLQILHLVWDRAHSWIHESIGVLGWLDTPLPKRLYELWYIFILVLLITALARAKWRQRAALIFIVAVAVAIPIGLVSEKARELGIVWQGRDGLPLTVGFILVAAALCQRRFFADRIVGGVIIGVACLLDALAFYINLRRYAVGLHGKHWFFLHNLGWSPPTGQFFTLAAYGVVTALIGATAIAWYTMNVDPMDTEFVAIDVVEIP